MPVDQKVRRGMKLQLPAARGRDRRGIVAGDAAALQLQQIAMVKWIAKIGPIAGCSKCESDGVRYQQALAPPFLSTRK